MIYRDLYSWFGLMPVGPSFPGPGGGGSGGGNSGGGGEGDIVPPPGEVIPPPEPGGGTQGDACTDPKVVAIGDNVDLQAPRSVGWYKDNRYHISIGGRTFAYDFLTGGWSNAGFGVIASAAVGGARSYPEEVVLAPRNTAQTGGPMGNVLWHTHKMLDLNAPNTSAPYTKRVTYGPFDGIGPDRTRLKWAKRVLVWGDYAQPKDATTSTESIGTITLISDSGYTESYPIWPVKLIGYPQSNPPRIYPPGMLCWQEFRPAAVGRVLQVQLDFTVSCVAVRQVMMEYSARS